MHYLLLILTLGLLAATPVAAEFNVTEKETRIEIHDDGKLVFGWQHRPLQNPAGGEVFAASAFVHPLCTPSGFVLTDIQPSDHLHHLGVWWPWKLVEVNGEKHITWEMQKREGRHDAVSAKIISKTTDEVVIEAHNQTKITAASGELKPVINETATLRFFRKSPDAYGLDIHIVQKPSTDSKVTIPNFRYSGFAWRGPASWNKDNSVMRTSGGNHRDNANHQPAKWLTVDGETPTGRATMLMMSGASKPELLRVWGAKQHNGAPFVNFNPVVKASLKLEPANKAVSERYYRLIISDREIPSAEAEKLWAEWQAE